jgi:hypothetical protein
MADIRTPNSSETFYQMIFRLKTKKPILSDGLFIFNLGNVLLSHTVAHAVPSALKGLTSVFGMGTGISPSPWSPRTFFREA